MFTRLRAWPVGASDIVRTNVEKSLTTDMPDLHGVGFLTLAYRIKLYPSQVKSDMLGMLCALFRREHHAAIDLLDDIVAQEGKLVLKGKSQAGQGEFKQRVRYRAVNDYKRARKSAKALKKQLKLPYLHAELCDAAEVQIPRKATSYDLWVHIEGLSKTCQLYLPARKHQALNRALDRPGATLGKSAQVMRVKSHWYAIVYVKCPLPKLQEQKKWIGVDVGMRSALVRSDGRKECDLRPILAKQEARTAERQRQGYPADFGRQTPQKQAIAIMAKKLVSVAVASRCGIAIEDPTRLPRYEQWAGRYLAKRLDVLAPLVGVAIATIAPPYTSITCPECGSVEKRQRHKELFRCWRCGYTHNADFVASRNIRARASLLRRAEYGQR